MEEIKKLAIPDGYEFDRVEGGEVILKKKEVLLPRTLEECAKKLGVSSCPSKNLYMPKANKTAIMALCKLLICRNVWWEQLGWKPDWKSSDGKWSIYNAYDDVRFGTFVSNSTILAFPTEDVRDQFYKAFQDLIEEAKELL